MRRPRCHFDPPAHSGFFPHSLIPLGSAVSSSPSPVSRPFAPGRRRGSQQVPGAPPNSRGRLSRAGGKALISAGCAPPPRPPGLSPPLAVRSGWPLLGRGPPSVCPSPQPLLPLLPSLEAAAFVNRGAGSSTGPSLTPFVQLGLCRWENQMRRGGWGDESYFRGSPC